MFLSLINLNRSMLGSTPDLWATQAHGVAFSLLVAAWLWPLVRMIFHRSFQGASEIEWVTLWRCPACNTYNRRATIICTHCDFHLKMGGLGKWIPLRVSEAFRRGRKRILWLYRLLGWMLFYGITGLAFWHLKLYVFRQDPTQELLASSATLLLLTSLIFFRRASGSWLRFPWSALLDFFAGFLVLSLFVFNIVLWNVSRSQRQEPLTYVQGLFQDWLGVQAPTPRPLPKASPQAAPSKTKINKKQSS